ncbi:MAG: VTT domain-containing protein [Thermoanaerobaculia bacterium]
MDLLRSTWRFLHGLDELILEFAREQTVLFYGLYSGSIFAETGLVVTPFLPSETLVFSVATLAAENGPVNPWLAGALAAAATLLGDVANLFIGRTLGRRYFVQREGRILGKRSVRWAERYFERYGPRTVFVCRFLPLIRTAAPFLAGMGGMPVRTFVAFNAAGAVTWAILFVCAGYFFGQIPAVERNFPLVVAAAACISLVPVGLELWHTRRLDGAEEEGKSGP